MTRLVVVGAGPVGLAAALGGLARGFEVTVLERGEVGEAMRRWGPTRLFSPLGMNVPESFRAALGGALPPDDALLTGPEMAERVLAPLAASPALAGRVRTRHRVVAIGRARMTRGDLPGHPLRAERPFRLLVETPEGEVAIEADRVLDASGVYGRPTALGAGGLPAPGERAAEQKITRDLGKLAEHRADLRGRRLLLIGHGHSAANALAALAAEAGEAGTRVVWATRSANARPCVEVADDPLPERRRVVERANALAAEPPPWLRIERRASVEAIAPAGETLAVTLSGGRAAEVDRIVALTGYRPDLEMLSELALEIAPATEGAGRLARAVANVTDCLAVPRVRAEDLASGEPGFHLVGAKSYGRARTFLLGTGYAQLATLLAHL